MSHHYSHISVTLDNGDKFWISCTVCEADSEGFSSFVRIEGIHHEGKHREAYKFLDKKYADRQVVANVIAEMEKKVSEKHKQMA